MFPRRSVPWKHQRWHVPPWEYEKRTSQPPWPSPWIHGRHFALSTSQGHHQHQDGTSKASVPVMTAVYSLNPKSSIEHALPVHLSDNGNIDDSNGDSNFNEQNSRDDDPNGSATDPNTMASDHSGVASLEDQHTVANDPNSVANFEVINAVIDPSDEWDLEDPSGIAIVEDAIPVANDPSGASFDDQSTAANDSNAVASCDLSDAMANDPTDDPANDPMANDGGFPDPKSRSPSTAIFDPFASGPSDVDFFDLPKAEDVESLALGMIQQDAAGSAESPVLSVLTERLNNLKTASTTKKAGGRGRKRKRTSRWTMKKRRKFVKSWKRI